MNFPFDLYCEAFVGALAVAAISLPFWRRWCLRIGLVDDPGQRKIHDTPVPLAGGLAVLTGVLLPLLLGALGMTIGHVHQAGTPQVVYGLSRRTSQLVAIAFGAVAMTILGLLDDRRELKPLPKFAGQLLIATVLAASGVRITLFVPSIVFSYVITLLWVLTVVNAFNFMDNMNGLCAGLGVIGSFYFAVSSAASGQYLVALIALLICGALLGFLPYNFPEARAFLGDSGSHLVGYLLAVLAILPHFYTKKNPHPWLVLTPLLVLAVPLGDLAYVVTLRYRLGKPFYVGDTNHLSHRLVRIGISRRMAVLLIWLIATIVGAMVFI